MSAVAPNTEVLEQLAAGDIVRPQESAKKRVATIGALIDEPYDGGRTPGDLREDMLERWSGPCEELLAILFPLVEYADERAQSVLGRSMLHIAAKTSLASQDRGWNRHCGVIALGRLLWAITAYSLHCRRLDSVAELSRASVSAPYGSRGSEPLIAMRDLHYPDALDRNAGNAYENYRDWLLARSLVPERYELFATEVSESFDDADLMLAMRAAVEYNGMYSASLETRTVRRLADRLRDPRCRVGLATVFRTTDAELDDTLERAFARVTTDQYRFDRPRTFWGADEE